jgi:heme exporter protein D
MDDVAWGVLTLSLTLLGGMYTYYAYQRRGLAAGLQGAAITLLPLAAYLTNTLKMFTRIADAVSDWATSLVFSPAVWLGVIVAGLSVLLFGAARVVERRSPTKTAPKDSRKERRQVEKSTPPAAPVDDDMAEIEAILRKRGIS